MIESDAARAEFRRGLGESFPIVIGLTAIGFIFGALARAAGLPWFEAGLMSAIVYAGPAQLIAVGLMKQGAGFVLIVLTTFLVNLRYVLYAASLAPHFRDRRPRWLAFSRRSSHSPRQAAAMRSRTSPACCLARP